MNTYSGFEFPRFNSGFSSGRLFSSSFVVYGPGKHLDIQKFLEPQRFTLILFDSKVDRALIGINLRRNLEVVIDGEPLESEILKILQTLPREPCNIIAIGGGSTMDFAKALVCSRHYPSDRRVGYDVSGDLNSRIESPEDFLVVAPTTVGSGSEASRYFVLFQQNRKLASRAWQALPRVIVLDPTLLGYLTYEIARIQLFDCWSHLIEVSLSHLEYSPINMFAIEGTKSSLMKFVKSKDTLASNQNLLQLQIFSYIGGVAISNTRTGALHTVGEALASQISIPHVWSLFFSAINWQELFDGNPRVDEHSVVRSSTEQVANALEDIKWWLPFLENLVDKHLILNVEEIERFDLLEFKKVVLSDQVLWKKEHPIILSEIEIENYLEMTVNSVRSFVGLN